MGCLISIVLLVAAVGLAVKVGTSGWQSSIGATPIPAPTETALPPPSLEVQQTDFRDFVAQVDSIQGGCAAAGKIAAASYKRVSQGGDTVRAYEDAQAAQDACDDAKDRFLTLSPPTSLADQSLGGVTDDLYLWARDEGNLWNDIRKVLNEESVVASVAGADKMSQEAQGYLTRVASVLVDTAQQLNVPVTSLTPTP